MARRTASLAAAFTLLCAAGCTLLIGVDEDYHLVGTGGACAASCCRDADCAVPEGPCQEARCEQGACAVVSTAAGAKARESAQTSGDCQDLVCDGLGAATAEILAEGAACTIAGGGAGVCDGAGTCVSCNENADCKSPDLPFCAKGACVSHDCANGGKDGDETDTDCGGADCARCADGKGCTAGADCVSGVCSAGKCAVPTCLDGVKNGDETDVDCGGMCAKDCDLGQGCAAKDDCASELCCGGQCLPVVEHIGLGQGTHACALTTDQRAHCWGNNGPGSLGDGTVGGTKPTPILVMGLDHVVQVVTASLHSCARKSDGTLWCWGYNSMGQLGIGATGGPACTGKCQPTPTQVTALGNDVASVTATALHTCAIKTDGTLWCAGMNYSGQLGDGTMMNRASPVQVTALGNTVAEVATSENHTCARKTDGTLWCWGRNDRGQLGDGTKTNHPTPVQVTALGTDVAGISAGYSHTCARKTDGSLWCWGSNDKGQLGDGTMMEKLTPAKVTALGTTVAAVSASITHTCARTPAGSGYCWGENPDGRLGSATPASSPTPLKVSALGNQVAEIAAGATFTCALKIDGTLWCFGSNSFGQLGDGTVEPKSTPAQVSLGVCP